LVYIGKNNIKSIKQMIDASIKALKKYFLNIFYLL